MNKNIHTLKIMEEKKYHFEEQEGEGMVCEPAPAYRSTVAEPIGNFVSTEPELPSSELFSHENLVQSINDFMETKDDASQWVSWNQVESHLLEEFPWLK